MRTGPEYRESLRDGRNVWIMGEGKVEDVTIHPATAGMVNEYAAWFDRHRDPEWQDVLLTPATPDGTRRPLAFEILRCADDLCRLGRAIYAQAFLSAGNVTHTPGYGALIALGILDAVKTMGEPQGHVNTAEAYREYVARTGTFLTLTEGAKTLGDRFRPPSEQLDFRIVKETDAGLVVTGRTGVHTSTPFAHDVYIGLLRSPDPNQRAMIVVPVNSPGARVVARKPAARHCSGFSSPLSSRYDELEAQLWLENVRVPWERVFAYRQDPPGLDESRLRERIFAWLTWHHQQCWLARADFTLGLALAAVDALGLRETPAAIAQVVDLIIDAQTIRSCLTASECEAEATPAGYYIAKPIHLTSAVNYTLRVRQRMAETLRGLPGSSLVITPTDVDLKVPGLGPELERAFGGGGYTALQRAALLNLIWDHVSSALDGRESTFELHASGGHAGWRWRAQRYFSRYNELANGVLKTLEPSVNMPELNLDGLRDVGPLRKPIVPAMPTARGRATLPADGQPLTIGQRTDKSDGHPPDG
jgi:aromatic ring hydroxylase